ncbi:hypothetical protein VIGAN_11064700 [Vigna angularis var. angularis]|uniref:Uncharacterized protein n=1 Tax=Vigna angularis var. angularis TaxID=157739 RepID=A0A0S3T8U6_PHAAN|nr:hypothetical protein VIGAN_11064700 [Vigna angularis var. angularis]
MSLLLTLESRVNGMRGRNKDQVDERNCFFVCDESERVKGQLIEVFLLDWKMVVREDKKEGCGVAEYLGLPYPPPYISMGSSRSLTGINYASASCGILPETGANFVIKSVSIYGSPRRCGGQGDILSGSLEDISPAS